MSNQTRRLIDASSGRPERDGLWDQYSAATRLALAGDHKTAAQELARLAETSADDLGLAARIHNDLGVLAAVRGDRATARTAFDQAEQSLPAWETPRHNAASLARRPIVRPIGPPDRRDSEGRPTSRTRVALVSLLFNWPSTGGGVVHTAETARFLSRAGYDVRHFVLGHPGWSVGQIREPVDWPVEVLAFDDHTWRRTAIQQRVRAAIHRFSPDQVILTDSWSFKPRLAEAVAGFPFYLRLAAQEGLCPLNNVRLLSDGQRGWQSCPHHQLARFQLCRDCVGKRDINSGALHRAERRLAGFDEPDYEASLRRAFAEAAGVLVVNPLIAENVKPYAQAVHVLPSGFDPERFPAPLPPPPDPDCRVRLLFAGLVDEPMKGFDVLLAACQRLWSRRRDFRLWATSEPVGRWPEFLECVGWQSQAQLPELMRSCDIVVCPTVAEEALGRTAVEAMGAGRPVVASRIGGLPFTVLDEATGLLCAPGDPDDLARQLARLLEDATLRERLGRCGRGIFEERFTWDVILPRYVSLLGPPLRIRS